MIILGIDYGEKRIGLAITDPMEIIASPLKTVSNDKSGLDELHAIIKDRRVEVIVVGLPLNMNGSLGPSGEAAKAFADQLGTLTGVPVETIDERLTSSQANRAMLSHDMSRAKRKSRIDEMAAQIILQSFIDRRKRI